MASLEVARVMQEAAQMAQARRLSRWPEMLFRVAEVWQGQRKESPKSRPPFELAPEGRGKWNGRVSDLTMKEYRDMKWGMDAGYRAALRVGPRWSMRGSLSKPLRANSDGMLPTDPARAYDACYNTAPKFTIGKSLIGAADPLANNPGPQYLVPSTMNPSGHPTIWKNSGATFGSETLQVNDEDPFMRWMLSQSLLVLAGLAKELDGFNPEKVCCNTESVDGLLHCANASAIAPTASHIHVTSLATREIHSYAVFSAAINAAHAKTFGNSFQLATSSLGMGSDLKLLWRAGNVATILEALKVVRASWIAYLDADAVLVDFSKDALADVVRAHATKETRLMVSRGELIGPGTSSMFNSGFLLVRQHPWAYDFVQLWLSRLSSSNANDQEVLEQLYRQDALGCRRHVAILPMGLVYSEIGNPISAPPDQQHVVHLAGIPDEVRMGVFSAFWKDLCGTNPSMALPGSMGLRQAYLEEMASFVSSQGDAQAEAVCQSPTNMRQCLEAAERLAYGLQLDGRQQEAVHWAAGALSGREQHLGTLDEDTLASRSTLATVMEAAGRKEEALAFSMAAWEGRKVTYGPNHRATMLSTARLGSQMLAHNRLEEATVFLQAAQQSDILGPQHSSSISTAAALASAYAKQSRYTEALALYRRTARSAAEDLGKHHATTLDLRLGVADTLRQMGQHDEAAAAGARLAKTQRRKLKTQSSRSDQLRLARALELVAGARVEKLPKRLKLIEEAAEVYAKLGIKSSGISVLRSGADMLQANGRGSEAESWFRRALDVAEGFPGDTEKGLASAVASAANNLAMLLRSRGKGAEAEGLLRRAAQGFAKEHQAAELRALGNLADTLRANGRLGEAFNISQRVMQSHELLESEDDVLTAKSNHALLLYALGNRAESAALYSDVLQQAERVFGAHSSQAAAARADLEELRRREAAQSSDRDRASPRPVESGRNADGPAPGQYDQNAFKHSGQIRRAPVYTAQGREAWRDPVAAPGPVPGEYNVERALRNGKITPFKWTMQGKTEPLSPARGERATVKPGPGHYKLPSIGERNAYPHIEKPPLWKFLQEPRGLLPT
ncbi:unnamed protein product [Symbiodinium sp. CCMP2456]|nr:unnamed protein product [Symbiodinium sp. CCMP2456]